MFIASQIPVADSRPFVPQDTGKLLLPEWPGALPGRDFVRGLGGVKARRRGGVAGWSGEVVYCDARRAVRLAGGAAVWRAALDGGGPMRVSFRRFLSDGGAVSRVELGAASRRDPDDVAGAAIRDLVHAWLGASLDVRGADGRWRPSPVITSGSPIAALLLRSTTRLRHAVAAEDWWLESARPIVLVQRPQDPARPTPSLERSVPALADAGLHVSSEPFDVSGQAAVAWLVNVAPDADPDVLRRLRIHVFRLHAERECLSRILRQLLVARLSIERGTAASEELQAYLAAAGRLLNRDTFFGLAQDQMLAAAYNGLDIVTTGEREDLLARLERARRSVRQKIEQATEPVEYFPT